MLSGPHCLTVVDLDGDGDTDAATVGKDDFRAVWYENDGKGVFKVRDIDDHQAAYDLRSLDMDGDRDPDLLVAGQLSRNVVWVREPAAPALIKVRPSEESSRETGENFSLEQSRRLRSMNASMPVLLLPDRQSDLRCGVQSPPRGSSTGSPGSSRSFSAWRSSNSRLTSRKSSQDPGDCEREGAVGGYLPGALRLDFCAIIRTADGLHRQVLIELQKSRFSGDILRFRHYLAERYTTLEEIARAMTIRPGPSPCRSCASTSSAFEIDRRLPW